MRFSVVAVCLLLWGCQSMPPKPLLPSYQIEGHQLQLQVGDNHPLEHGQITLLEQHQIDLNGDSQPESVGVLLMQTGGSGSFYYVAASGADGSPLGSALLGDRIKLDGVKSFNSDHVDAGTFYVSYYIHGAKQAFAEQPKFYLSKQFGLVDGKLTHLSAY